MGSRTRELAALFNQAGNVGPSYWLARRRADRWAARLVTDIRDGRLQPPAGSAASVIARHRDLDGHPLPPLVAAVELLNVLRPRVAVSVFIVFVALALHEYPECRQMLMAGEEGYAHRFVQEVRRFYPFFPAVGARVRHAFEWKGYRFPAGRRVLLDLYGTDHDPRIWQEAERFRPERFAAWDGNPFELICQGGWRLRAESPLPGGVDRHRAHEVGTDFLARRLTYDVPAQDLRIDRSRLPALPRSLFILSNVRGEEGNRVANRRSGQGAKL